MMQTGSAYDLKSQRRIDVMMDAKAYLSDCLEAMDSEEKELQLRELSHNSAEKTDEKSKPETSEDRIRENCNRTKGQYKLTAQKALVSIQHIGALTIAEEKSAELNKDELDKAHLHIASVIYYELAFDGIKLKDAQSEKVDEKFYAEQVETVKNSEAFRQVTKHLDRKTLADIADDPRKITNDYRKEIVAHGLRLPEVIKHEPENNKAMVLKPNNE